jgi:hypothetical protein
MIGWRTQDTAAGFLFPGSRELAAALFWEGSVQKVLVQRLPTLLDARRGRVPLGSGGKIGRVGCCGSSWWLYSASGSLGGSGDCVVVVDVLFPGEFLAGSVCLCLAWEH